MHRTISLLFLSSTLSASVSAQVSGTVVDNDTDEPVAGAVVSVQASNIETTTDGSGAFELTDATGAGLTIVAGAKGYFYASSSETAPASDVALRLEPVPQEDDPYYTFTSPKRCGVCHPDQYDEWVGSPMQKAGMNTWVYDIYDGTGTGTEDLPGFIYTRDSVFAENNPASECASCHQPEPWAREPFQPMGDRDEPTPGMLHGVSCDMCHSVADIDVSNPNFPGIFPGVVTLTRPQGNRWVVMYGALGDVTYEQTGWMRAAYQPQLKSEVCAACHQDANDPNEDHSFEVAPLGPAIISEPTYVEWLDTPYADPEDELHAECVDCHMAATNAGAACDRVSLNRPDGDVRSHRILGTTAEFLENALSVTMEANIVGDSVEVQVAITNDQTGHHVPTGVTIRNMILLVEASQDSEPLEHTGSTGVDEVIHLLGGTTPDSPPGECNADPDQGYYCGLPGRLYGKINISEAGGSPTFFTDAVAIVSDNRIPALETDTSNYTFAVPAETGDIEIRARVIYRRSWRVLVDGKDWQYDGHGNTLEDLEPPHFGHLMASAEKTLTTGAPIPDAGVPDAGEPDAGAPDGGTDGGSGCSVGSTPTPGAPLLAFLLAAALLTRRRRQKRGQAPFSKG
ncbi:MAG: carboxypeptidase-like regulatory domain-containing protein [Deltaproteobacteria bacterium]|nr:carboxypeptidase-like regulatory domain-containing protein [Deltaproteobacteria bacterium]